MNNWLSNLAGLTEDFNLFESYFADRSDILSYVSKCLIRIAIWITCRMCNISRNTPLEILDESDLNSPNKLKFFSNWIIICRDGTIQLISKKCYFWGYFFKTVFLIFHQGSYLNNWWNLLNYITWRDSHHFYIHMSLVNNIFGDWVHLSLLDLCISFATMLCNIVSRYKLCTLP